MFFKKEFLYYIPIVVIFVLGILLYLEDEKLNQFYLEQEELDIKAQDNIEKFFKSLINNNLEESKADYSLISNSSDIRTAFLFNSIEKNALSKKSIFVGNKKVVLNEEQIENLKKFNPITKYNFKQVNYNCKFYELKCSSIEKYQNAYLNSINSELEQDLEKNLKTIIN